MSTVQWALLSHRLSTCRFHHLWVSFHPSEGFQDVTKRPGVLVCPRTRLVKWASGFSDTYVSQRMKPITQVLNSNIPSALGYRCTLACSPLAHLQTLFPQFSNFPLCAHDLHLCLQTYLQNNATKK